MNGDNGANYSAMTEAMYNGTRLGLEALQSPVLDSHGNIIGVVRRSELQNGNDVGRMRYLTPAQQVAKDEEWQKREQRTLERLNQHHRSENVEELYVDPAAASAFYRSLPAPW